MKHFDRLPAYPLIANDPYFSVWMPADLPTDTEAAHWCGDAKPIRGVMDVDGRAYTFFGPGRHNAETTAVWVTATKTCYVSEAGGVQLTTTFRTPALPDDLDVLSAPITYVDFEAVSLDGQKHTVCVRMRFSPMFCYDGRTQPEMLYGAYREDGLNFSYMGQKHQKILCHSGDRITIDWGYLYTVSAQETENGEMRWHLEADREPKTAFLLVGYDDIASINYFGTLCKAWYARNGKTIKEALLEFARRHDELAAKCDALDEQVRADALAAGGEDYVKIVNASWRHVFAAHKLIATPKGEMAFLSKENDSNGCIGTVDLVYPSSPIFLKYCPELCNAMCRPVLEFACMPVWRFDFAPHDVGRYPYCVGQRYGCRVESTNGVVIPPIYMYPPENDIFNDRYQMPVEESGNMLCVMYAAIAFGADDTLAKQYLPTLSKWVRYLDEYGEDPGEQLCTDDFAGHLAHNVNLSAKALMGIACYAKILEHFGDKTGAAKWMDRAKDMAGKWLERVERFENSPLTFDGTGWSMKYNLIWDLVFDFGLLPDAFYKKETESYLPRMNKYGLPLDSRADYTKSDWLCWCAAMAKDEKVRTALLAPLAAYLNETRSRVAFSDWYDTKTGNFVEFIARSVQGGVFMPMLTVKK